MTETKTKIQRLYEATARLIAIAEDDTGQSVRCRNFILAWWNADKQGGFNPIDLANVDQAVADDMLTVLTYLATVRLHYPEEFKARIEGLIAIRGPRKKR